MEVQNIDIGLRSGTKTNAVRDRRDTGTGTVYVIALEHCYIYLVCQRLKYILIPMLPHRNSRPTVLRIYELLTTPTAFMGPTEVCGNIVTMALQQRIKSYYHAAS